MSHTYIGTSGFSYPHWKGVLYVDTPQQMWLEHYAEIFRTVEINATFYRLMPGTTVMGWKERTPDDFKFAIKGSKYITHQKRLLNIDDALCRFKDSVTLLDEKLAVILWQLPPSMREDVDRLVDFFSRVKNAFPTTRHAVEFRNSTWYTARVFSALGDQNIAICFSDMPGCEIVDPVTADFVYMRCHGNSGDYCSSYSDAQLHGLGDRIRGWEKEGRDAYIFFNNDIDGHAVRNARFLQENY